MGALSLGWRAPAATSPCVHACVRVRACVTLPHFPRFLGYKTFMLSVHCYMVRNPDVRYFDDTGHLGLWTVVQGQITKLTRADLASLAVQSPYILMMPRTDGSFSSRAAPFGDELPGIQVLLRIALYSAWWRDLRSAEDDTKKANQNRALAYALSEGSAGEHATRQQLLDAVALANQSKFSPELREYVGRTGNEGFFKNWTSTELKAMVVSNGVLGTSLIPLWVQSLVDQDAVQRKSIFNSLATTPSMTPRSTTHLSTIPTLRFPRVEVSSRSSLNTTPRTLRGYPWTMVDAKDSVQQQTPRDVNFVLGRNFPKRNRVLVPAGDLNAHVEYTGWSYPEFEATSRGKFDSAAQHEKYLDAAGLARLGGGRSVVASMPGVFARNFTPRSKKDFQTSLDNFQVCPLSFPFSVCFWCLAQFACGAGASRVSTRSFEIVGIS